MTNIYTNSSPVVLVDVPVSYIPFAVDPTPRITGTNDHLDLFKDLRDHLNWEHRDAPRQEYYCNDFPEPYVYGKGRGQRTYQPQPYTEAIKFIRRRVETLARCKFEVCFLNRYLNQRDQLGWHADDSPEMDDARPIAVVSFGVEREIWFRPKGSKQTTVRLSLAHGSVCLMHAGMQDLFQHRIPKASFECGERISLTFRGYVPQTSDK